MNPQLPENGWHTRGYVPHFDGGPVPQTVTFRLSDSFPGNRLGEWEEELARMPSTQAERERRRRIEEYLDEGIGSTWLKRPDVAEIVQQTLLHFNGHRYEMHAWTIMPNHVHALLTPRSGHSLSTILHSWKSFTGTQANKILGRTGPFWQTEYFDRFVRNAEHFTAAVEYIENNPVKAGLCQAPKEWRFSSSYAE